MNIKKIFGAKTSQKIATLLSMSALIFPLVGCDSKDAAKDNVNNSASQNQELQAVPEIQGPQKIKSILYDASYINAEHFFDGYVENFDAGNTSYIIEEMDKLKKAYETLLTPAGTFIADTNGYTFNFDGSLMPYDKVEVGTYYKGNIPIKKIRSDYVELKIRNGALSFRKNTDDNSLIINNTNKAKQRYTTITINKDGTYEIVESTPDTYANAIYTYTKDGLLQSAQKTNSLEQLTFNEGNPHDYTAETHSYKKVVHADGSYTFTQSSWHIEFPGSTESIQLPSSSDITYYYDANNTPTHAIALIGSPNDSYMQKCTAKPDGSYVLAVQKRNSDGKIIYSEITEHDNKTTTNRLVREVDDEGLMHTKVETTDSSLLRPSSLFKKDSPVIRGDTTYLKIDGIEYIKSKDGFIYNYNQNDPYMGKGQFVKAYHVVNPSKVEYADENGNVICVEDNIKITKYTDYANNIKSYIGNKGQSQINVEFNGNTYVLEENGYISKPESIDTITYVKNHAQTMQIYPNGNKIISYYDDEKNPIKTEFYDANDEIIKIFQNGESTEYYDYKNNIIKSITDRNKIYISFYEDTQTPQYICNKSKDYVYYYNDLELKKDSYLYLYKNGVDQKYYYDKTKYYEKNEDGEYIKSRRENGTFYEYYQDSTAICSITTNADNPDLKEKTHYQKNGLIYCVCNKQTDTYYYADGIPEGEQQPIKYIRCNSEEPLVVYDNAGNEYMLNKGDSIGYNVDGSFKYIQKGNIYYYEYPANIGNDFGATPADFDEDR